MVLSHFYFHEFITLQDVSMVLQKLNFKNVVDEIVKVVEGPKSCHVDQLVDRFLLRLDQSNTLEGYEGGDDNLDSKVCFANPGLVVKVVLRGHDHQDFFEEFCGVQEYDDHGCYAQSNECRYLISNSSFLGDFVEDIFRRFITDSFKAVYFFILFHSVLNFCFRLYNGQYVRVILQKDNSGEHRLAKNAQYG